MQYLVLFKLYIILNVCNSQFSPWRREHHRDFSSTLGHIKPRTSSKDQKESVQDLIRRIIPDKANFFTVKILPDDTKDSFQIKKIGNNIQITGTTGVVAANGFNYYLKYFCHCHISWESSQLNLPDELPDVNVTITLNGKLRYYQNVCTTSYSFVWWDWKQWEKHLDWIALNGFNLVLASNGQEAIWERVYKTFNLTDNDINEQFSGPAFLSWLRMGNLRGWGGSLSSAWHTRSINLQKQILERMRNLGMIPLFPAFAGYVPRAFKTLYPHSKMEKLGSWARFNDTYCCPYFLDPTEDLFNKIGRSFLTELISEFGTDHVYSCDSFNENTPSSGDLSYLANISKAIYKAMTDVDHDAIWLMQSWMIVNDPLFWTENRVKATVTAVPTGKLVILDLQSEQAPQYEIFHSYFGQPFIWCMLHNFGGTLGMFGSSSIINEEPIRARHIKNSTMIGTGLTMEGINQNYVIYDLMTESAWRKAAVNLTQWFEDYSTRRYGRSNEHAKNSWRILQHTVYDYGLLNKMRGKYVINRSPSLKIQIWTWYNISDLINAWTYLLEASINLEQSSGYLHDLVDTTRQFLQVSGDLCYKVMVDAYIERNNHDFEIMAKLFLEVFPDLESILATNEAFLLGRWLQSAKDAASNSEEERQFEFNARNQITLWGPRGEIMDYANKQWAGVVSHFFAPRWILFIDYLNATLINGQPFNQSFISEKIFKEVEEPFTFDRSEFPVEPVGSTVEIAQDIHRRWLSRRYFKFVLKSQKTKVV